MSRTIIITEAPLTQGTAHVLRSLCTQTGIEAPTRHLFPTQYRDFITRERKAAIPDYPPIEPGRYIRADASGHLTSLFQAVNKAEPNCIIALGNAPLWALTRMTGIAKWRGIPTMSRLDIKLVATWAPGAIVKQWELRPIAYMDFLKAARQSENKLLVKPKSYIHMQPTLQEIADFYERYIVPAPYLAVDIETKAGTVTEIGFAVSPRRALVIPFWDRERGNYWPTLAAEREARAWCRRILEEKDCVGQNFQYDMQYLWRTMGIPTPRFVGDTMLLHHSLQPELKKGLGFLASLYTDRPSWKFMRTDADNLKREDD